MAKGFIVARIKYNDRSIFHCIDGEKKNRLYLQEDLLPKISEGKIVNGFVCKGETSDYIRLAEGVPTVVRSMNFDLMDFCSFIPGYFGQSGPAKAYTQKSFGVAAKRGLVSRERTVSDFEEMSRSGAENESEVSEYTAWDSKGVDYYVDIPKTDKLYRRNVERVTKSIAFIKAYVTGNERIEFSKSDVCDDIQWWKDPYHYNPDVIPFSDHGRTVVYWISRVVNVILTKEKAGCCMSFKLKSMDGQRDWAICFRCGECGKAVDASAEIRWRPKNCHSGSGWNMIDECENMPSMDNPYYVCMTMGENVNVASYIAAYLLEKWAFYRAEHGI